MKKNKMMRLASALLVMTLMTTSVISGTFAKYTTTSSASDNARVAKWGVTLTANGLLYSERYNAANSNEGTEGTDNVTVATYNGTQENVVQSVVAPGTQNTTGVTFTIDGRPEVAVALTGKLEAATTVLPKANYVVVSSSTIADGGVATVSEFKTHTLPEAYYPVEYTLKKNGVSGYLVENGTLLAVCETLDPFFYNGDNAECNTAECNTVEYKYEDTATTLQDYAPNAQDLGVLLDDRNDHGKYTLTWKWNFDNDKDVYDTFLGDLAYAAMGQNGSIINESATVCYVTKNATTGNTFYSVKAYELAKPKYATAVTYADLAEYGIGITEEFAMEITATQID